MDSTIHKNPPALTPVAGETPTNGTGESLRLDKVVPGPVAQLGFATKDTQEIPRLDLVPIAPKDLKVDHRQAFDLDAYAEAITERRDRVYEFRKITEIAKSVGVESVWLTGPSATSWMQYVHWDLQREAGNEQIDAERFNYNWINLFDRNQPIDLGFEGSPHQGKALRDALLEAMPHLAGEQGETWQPTAITTAEHSACSVQGGLVELSASPGRIVNHGSPTFLEDNYQRSAKFVASDAGIHGVLEFVGVVGRHRLHVSEAQLASLEKTARGFNPERDLRGNAQRRQMAQQIRGLYDTSMDAVVVEKILQRLNLVDENRGSEPLPAHTPGLGVGIRPAMLGVRHVAHGILHGNETTALARYTKLTRAPDGVPNITVSTEGAGGQVYGTGHYVTPGHDGWSRDFDSRRPDLAERFPTVRYAVHPMASGGMLFFSGRDFTRNNATDYVFTNRDALRLMPSRPDTKPVAYFQRLAGGDGFALNELGIADHLGRLVRNQAQWLSPDEFHIITEITRDVAKRNPLSETDQFLLKESLAVFVTRDNPGVGAAIEAEGYIDLLLSQRHGTICRTLVEDVLSNISPDHPVLGPRLTSWRRKLLSQDHRGQLEKPVLEHLLTADTNAAGGRDRSAILEDLRGQADRIKASRGNDELLIAPLMAPLRAHLLSSDHKAREAAIGIVDELLATGTDGQRKRLATHLLPEAALHASTALHPHLRRWIDSVLTPDKSTPYTACYQSAVELYSQPCIFTTEEYQASLEEWCLRGMKSLPGRVMVALGNNEDAMRFLEQGDRLRPLMELLLARDVNAGTVRDKREVIELVLSRPAVLQNPNLPVAEWLRLLFERTGSDGHRALSYHVLTQPALQEAPPDVVAVGDALRAEILHSF